MKKPPILSRVLKFIRRRKYTVIIIVIVCAVGGYKIYQAAIIANAVPQYVLSPVRTGSIIQTVSGTGQVSASNQTDILSQVSGTITGINVSVGQAVYQGQLIATIDSKNASISLQNSKLSYAKLVQPAKTTDVSNAQNSIDQAYTSAFNAASTIYLDLPNIVSGMKDLLYGQAGFISDQRSSYLTSTARTYRETAGIEYDSAVNLYQAGMLEFKSTSRASATSTIDKMLSDTYTMIKAMSKAVSDTQTAITFITTTQPDYYSKDAATAASSVTAWASQTNSDLSSLASARNSIDSSENSYTTLVTGADTIDLEQARLTLQQAQQTYDNYFVRAPYDGVIGRIPVSVYSQAGGSTAIATIIGKQNIATISLDEVDAAKVKNGQPVNVTFDAIDGLVATGTVSQVDLIGIVTQGVVSYSVKINIDTRDERIKPGMSVNTTIIANQKDGVIIVPSAAIKTQSGKSYVQTFDATTLGSNIPGQFASTTRQFGSSTAQSSGRQFASSSEQLSSTTRTFASSTRSLGSTSNQFSSSNTVRTTTISSATAPKQTFITIGLSDDTNTEVISGLGRGDLVVTRTIAASAAQTTATTPSLLSGLGARTGGGTGGVRPGGTGGATGR